jgi:aminoglycoside phosphotransferase
MKLPAPEDFETNFKSEIWRRVAEEICAKHKIPFTNLKRAEQGDSVVFLVDECFVVKIFAPGNNCFAREMLALETARTNLKIPEIVACGEIENYKYLVTTQIKGELMTREIWLKLAEPEQIGILSQLAEGLKNLHQSDATKIDFDWHAFIAEQAETCFERQKKCGVNEKVLAQIPKYLEENLQLLPADFKESFLHGDVHFGNLRVQKTGGEWEISGLFDFADSLKGFHEYDFLAVGVLMIQGQGDLQREFFRCFDYADAEIDETLRKRLMILTMFYEYSDLRRYAIRLRPEAVDYSLDELERAIWNFV